MTDVADTRSVLVVERWRRYGHDRAYVKLGEIELGYRDLRSGAVHCDNHRNIEAVTEATSALFARSQESRAPEYEAKHRRADGVPTVGLPPASAPSVPAAPCLEPDRDLAQNVAGQAVRQKADELRAAAPIRSAVARALGIKTDERNYRVGESGEAEVARRLAQLGPGWHVLHAVPVGSRGSDIDHLVIGRAGVFTVNVKNHPGGDVWARCDTVKVNGHNQPYVRNSHHEIDRAAKLLTAVSNFDVHVLGLIAVVGMHRLTVKKQPQDGSVRILSGKDLVRHLEALPPVLGTPSIDRIYAVARHLATWQPTTVEWQELPD